jgi:hypothetical protein
MPGQGVKIAGGFYREEMLHPAHSAYLGSGLRAAAALAGTAKSLELWSYVSKSELRHYEAATAAYGVVGHHALRSEAINFHYAHGCSRPTLEPDVREIQKAGPFELDGEIVVRFGFLEGSCVVRANRAVYDPQSEVAPEPFAANGSTAKAWAMVLNATEAEAFTGKRNVATAARALHRDHGCDVVVVKCGSRGALVHTRKEDEWVAAHLTPSVFPLGSGDVFTAFFAWHWAAGGASPKTAAMRASRATAFYCANRFLPLPSEADKLASKKYPPLPRKAKSRLGKVYLAGPFFDLGQRWLVDELRQALIEQGLDVFSPIHDVGEGDAATVAAADLKGLRSTAVVLACVDGLDTGTAFEIGYARSRGIPVIALATGPLRDADMTMLTGTDCRLVRDVASAVYGTAWLASGG